MRTERDRGGGEGIHAYCVVKETKIRKGEREERK